MNLDELEDFKRKLTLKGTLKPNSIQTYLNIASLYLPFSELTKEKVEIRLASLSTNKSINTHLAALRHLANLGFISQSAIAGFKSKKTKKSKVQSKKELITREELMTLIKGTKDLMMQTILFVLYETGARIREILYLKVDDVLIDELGAILSVDGKTGPRDVRVIEAYSYLLRWLAHRGDSPGDLFEITYYTFYNALRRLVTKCGIKKKIYPHLFRHSRATEIASKLKPSVIEKHLGWKKGSSMLEIYGHLDSTDVDEALSDLYGIKPKKDPLQIRTCPRCNIRILPEDGSCPNCGLVLEIDYQTATDNKIKRKLLSDPEFIAFVRSKVAKIMDEEE